MVRVPREARTRTVVAPLVTRIRVAMITEAQFLPEVTLQRMNKR
jgi:hypothetical protein